jgi:signal transduction histidine kinase
VSAVAVIGQSAGARLALAVLLALAAARAYGRSRGSARRARLPAFAGAVALAAVLAAGAVADALGAGESTDRALLWAYDAAIALVAAGLALDLVRGRWAEATVTTIVVDLGDVPEEGVLCERLAAALGDRSLAVGYWSHDDGAFLDERGRRLELPHGDPGREVTIVREGAVPVAALVHDPATLEDPALRDSVAAAVRVAVANVRLQREIRRQAEELTVSRRRIVEAADLERRRLERELRDRTESRLDHLESLLAGAAADGADGAMLAATLDELAAARTELAELAQGIHPRLLTEQGLAAALADLARRAAVPVELDVPPARLPAVLEAAAYFLCSEALANITKHADASRATIEVVHANGRLRVAVHDDGTGGAEPGAGFGLRGLADRVEALGGRFRVESTSGGGTTVAAELPLDGL